MNPVFSITDWDTIFENCSSRKLRNLNWVPIPNGHDSVEYSRLMNRKDGPEIFAAWILLIQVASKCVERGVLKSSNGRPYEAEELAVKTRAPEKIFVKALPYLCSSGWIISDQPPADSADTSADSADASADIGRLAALKGREGKGIEKNGREVKTPNPLDGVFPKNLISEKFKKAWSEWVAHRAEIKKPLKPTQVTKQLKRLSDLGEAGAIEALEHTMENGWQGIRQPHQEETNGKPKALENNTPDARLKEIEKEMQNL